MIVQNARDIGLAIRERRRSLGLDQAALAERVGVSRQWIIKIEQGKPNAQIGLVLTALKALDLRLDVDSVHTHQDDHPASLVDIGKIIARTRSRRD